MRTVMVGVDRGQRRQLRCRLLEITSRSVGDREIPVRAVRSRVFGKQRLGSLQVRDGLLKPLGTDHGSPGLELDREILLALCRQRN